MSSQPASAQVERKQCKAERRVSADRGLYGRRKPTGRVSPLAPRAQASEPTRTARCARAQVQRRRDVPAAGGAAGRAPRRGVSARSPSLAHTLRARDRARGRRCPAGAGPPGVRGPPQQIRPLRRRPGLPPRLDAGSRSAAGVQVRAACSGPPRRPGKELRSRRAPRDRRFREALSEPYWATLHGDLAARLLRALGQLGAPRPPGRVRAHRLRQRRWPRAPRSARARRRPPARQARRPEPAPGGGSRCRARP